MFGSRGEEVGVSGGTEILGGDDSGDEMMEEIRSRIGKAATVMGCSGRNNVQTPDNFRKYPVNSLLLRQNVRTKKAQFGELSYRSKCPVQ